jgi:hypothetical protein
MATLALLSMIAVVAAAPALAQDDGTPEDEFTATFNTDHCTWMPIGQSAFFSLAPGTKHVLEGEEDGEEFRTVIEVLHRTRIVDGAATRVIEERHYIDGELDEISRNFFSMCFQNRSFFYFGEEVDYYEDGEIIGHEGAWLSGVDGARYGLYMPALPLLGARYYQEFAPGAALDRAEIVSLSESVEVPVGSYEGCLETVETTPLEPDAEDSKLYCPGVGIVDDAGAMLIEFRPGNLGLWPAGEQ